MSNIQIRIDEKTKREATRVLDAIGLDMDTAITMYLKQIVTRKEIPFAVITKNGLTWLKEEQIVHAAEEARQGKNVSRSMRAKEAISYLKAL